MSWKKCDLTQDSLFYVFHIDVLIHLLEIFSTMKGQKRQTCSIIYSWFSSSFKKKDVTEEVQLEAGGCLEPQESPPDCETIPTAPQVST